MTFEIYNLNICKQLKLNFSKLNILEILFTWIMRNRLTTNLKIINNVSYQWFDLSVLAQKVNCSYATIKNIIKHLESVSLISRYHDRKRNKLYIAINYSNYLKLLNLENKNSLKRIEWIQKNRSSEMNVTPLLNLNVDIPKYSKEADHIVRLILKKYPQYFSHKVPEEGKAPTKLYVKMCRVISDIYNGNFTKSRIYNFGDNFYNNKTFNVDGWQDKVKAVNKDWVKVKKLILDALKNFELMHDSQYMPYSKDFLQTNLCLWFYDEFSNDGPQSQFVQCLFTPDKTSVHNSELKADRIFETLSNTAKKGGNNLFNLNENMSAGTFWEDVSKMVDWGNNLLEVDSNARYWINSGDEIPQKYFEWIQKQKKMTVSNITFNIEKSVKNNAPWVWFVDSAITEHDLNMNLYQCIDINDFEKFYKKELARNDENSEIIF